MMCLPLSVRYGAIEMATIIIIVFLKKHCIVVVKAFTSWTIWGLPGICSCTLTNVLNMQQYIDKWVAYSFSFVIHIVILFFFFLFSVIIICNSVYIFLHLTAMYSSTFGKGWVGRSCLYLLVWVSFGSFSLRELTCMHCVYLALWTCKVLCGSFLCAIYKFSFIHSYAAVHWQMCQICSCALTNVSDMQLYIDKCVVYAAVHWQIICRICSCTLTNVLNIQLYTDKCVVYAAVHWQTCCICSCTLTNVLYMQLYIDKCIVYAVVHWQMCCICSCTLTYVLDMQLYTIKCVVYAAVLWQMRCTCAIHWQLHFRESEDCPCDIFYYPTAQSATGHLRRVNLLLEGVWYHARSWSWLKIVPTEQTVQHTTAF